MHPAATGHAQLPARPPAKVLVAHNRYLQAGGEDAVFTAETELLEANGHAVIRHVVSNDRVAELGRLQLGQATVWNHAAYRELRELLRSERPDLLHVHNTLPLLSPAVYHAARAEGVSVVQTLHNYRLVCPNALLYREGAICEQCVGKRLPVSAVLHACYRDSRAASGAVATMLSAHRALGTWSSGIDAYIALTEFARGKFVEGGLPAERIQVKPNFVSVDPGKGEHRGRFALFVGRLSPEKGIPTLLDAWRHAGIAAGTADDENALALKVVGDGPLEVTAVDGVEWMGRQPRDRVLSLMRDAAFLIFPSTWYEGFPVVLAEALAAGLPVIASRLGAMAEIIDDHRTGLHFRAGDAADLATKIRWAADHRYQLREMSRNARLEYETKYTPESNYAKLIEIYRMATCRSSPSSR